ISPPTSLLHILSLPDALPIFGHPHGQIYAYPFVTPRTRSTLDAIRELGPDLFARILEREQAGPRVVLAGEHWTAFVPFAARWPRSEEHTSELQSRENLVCRLL